MRSRLYQTLREQVPTESVDADAAVSWLKERGRKTFDETVELHVHLGIDASKSDQLVRGVVQLPSGAATARRVVVIATDADQQAAALAAGAQRAGGEELIAEIKESGTIDADIVVATPAAMPKLAAIARLLGPKGLMPNPKMGTVSPDPAATVKELLGGKLTFKMDNLGNIHAAVGKLSWDSHAIVANIDALLDAIQQVRPATVRGVLLRTVTLKSTMSPAVRVRRER